MADEADISKETFLQMAETAGLDVSSPHMDDLYHYFRKGVLPSLRAIREFDLGDWEPATLFAPPTG